MKKSFLSLVLLGLLIDGTKIMAADYYLKESLDQLPSTSIMEKTGQNRIITGRLERTKALLCEDGIVSWSLKNVDKDCLIEFWLKPEKWSSQSSAAVPLMSFTAGNDVYQLEKAVNQAELQLTKGDNILQSYPIYNWFPQPWMVQSGRDLWHYVLITVAHQKITLTVDGFATRTLKSNQGEGFLTSVSLQGGTGTAFSDLHVVSSRPLSMTEIRNRYRSQYRGEPEFYRNAVTVPMVSRPPSIDGHINPGEWEEAAALAGFTRLRGQSKALNGDPISAYLAYDQKYLYLAIRTPYKGTLNAKNWGNLLDMPLYGEESWEIFIHPPFTGTPDFCQLIGNPYSNQCDLKMLNTAWNGRWDWKASIQEGEWVAECRVEFRGCDMPQPKDGAVWTMNMANSDANAAWCYAMAYNDVNSFGILRFESSPAVVRPGVMDVKEDTVRIPLELLSKGKARELSVTLQTFGPTDILPASEVQKIVRLAPGQRQQIELETSIRGLTKGTFAVTVREGDNQVYYHQVGFPAAPPEVRQGPPAVVAADSKPATVQAPATTAPLTEAEKAYARKWTAEELGEELLNSTKWHGNLLGITTDVPKPWTTMQVKGQTIDCWGRSYQYNDSALPVQVTSGGEKLFAAPPRVVLTKDRKRFVFEKAAVQMQMVNDGLVRVETVSRTGPYELRLLTDYEFDGMARTEMRLTSPDAGCSVDGLFLEFPFQPLRSSLFHVTATSSGHPPASDSGFVPKEGKRLDEFRELIWLGDHVRGFCWFTEGMENWQIKDENGIQVIEPVRDGARLLRIKLGDKPFALDHPLTLVFGFQATPTRLRSDNFRSLSDFCAIEFPWFWGDGEYTIWQSHVKEARNEIQTVRAAGREVVPCSSLLFYGQYRFAKSLFGDIPDPGLINRENLLWGSLWSVASMPLEAPHIPEQHTAPGDWYNKQYAPTGLVGYCAASDFQDYYLWRLNDLIQKTSLGGLYLDQPAIRCSNAHHGCGYVNYRGQWTPRLPLFAMRKMVKRIYQLFYDQHGKTCIRWHCSNQILIPVMSFVDTYWDGENYGSGPLRVGEFYSKILSEGRLQTAHTGLQFGFAPDLLPEFEGTYAPTPASIRDMMGLLMIHDSTVSPAHSAHDYLTRFLQNKRLSVALNGKKILYYWDNDPRLRVSPATVKPILHFDKSGGLLILFNWSDDPVDTEVRLDLSGLGFKHVARVHDLVSDATFSVNEGLIRVPLLPRDLRMLELLTVSR